jgi:uncharacterized repeat protein (TIGR01451 family)
VPGSLVRHVVIIDQCLDRIYVLGGKVGGLTSNKVYYAAFLTDGMITGWSSSDMPAMLYSAAGVASQGWIYLAGGYDDTYKVYTNSVYSARPNPYTGRIAGWYLRSTLPTRVANHSLVACGDYLYLVGGQSVVGGATPTLADVYYARFDPTSGSVGNWVPAESLLTPTAGHAAIIHDGKLYVVGGFTKNTSGKLGLADVTYGEIDPTNSSIKGWISTSPLPTSLYHHAAIASGDYMYVIGGYDDNAKRPSSSIYRAQIDASGALSDWQKVSQPVVSLPPLQRHGADISGDGSIYVVGGETDSGHNKTTYYAPTILFSKLADPAGPVYVGDRITYTIPFTSTGIRAFEDVLITDGVPGSTRLVTASISATITSGSHSITPSWDLHTVTWTIPYLDELAAGRVSFQVEVTDPGVAVTRVSGSATAPTIWSFAPTPASVAPALHWTWTQAHVSTLETLEQYRITGVLRPDCEADLRLEKSSNQALVVAGQLLTYTLLVHNDGPSTAEGVVVTDDLPDDVTLKSATPSPSSPSPLRWSLGSIPPGGSRRIQLVVRVDPDASGTIMNTAVVNSSTSDPHSGNNRDREWTVVVRQADLRIEKVDDPDPVTPAETLTYTLIVTNDGPSDAQDVSVLDFLPPDLDVIATTPLTVSSPYSLAWRLDLPAGQSQVIQVVAIVDPDSAGVIRNVAMVSSDIEISPSNNVDEEWTAIGCLADLSIEKSDDPDPVNAGETLTYTLWITNEGPSVATNVIVTDTLPAGLCSFEYLPPNCHRDPSAGDLDTVVCDLGTLSAGESEPIEVRVTVCSGSTGTLLNQAEVRSDVPDSTPGNNRHDEETAIGALADLRLEKSRCPDLVVAGSRLTYTLHVANDGPSDALDVTVTDTLPVGTRFITATPPVTVDLGIVIWRTPTLRSGQSWEPEVVVQVEPGVTGALTNATVVASIVPDNDQGNNEAKDRARVYALADLSLKKYSSLDRVVGGQTLVYTLQVRNDGPSDARDVVVNDILPAGVTFRSAVPAPQGGPGPLTWEAGVLTAGDVLTISLTTKVDSSARGLLVNTAIVDSGVSDPDPLDRRVEVWTLAPVMVTNTAVICEDGRWCKESNTVVIYPCSIYLPVILRGSN